MTTVRLRSGLTALVVAVALAFLELTSAGAASPGTAGLAPTPSASTTIAPGSLIIPMDTDTTSNHAAFNQNQGMWKAYGLIYRLLQNGIPVRWAINESKTATTDVDFTVTSVKDKRTNAALGSWDYRGGPFIVDGADAAAALPIVSAWWAANGNQPNVHEALAGFSAATNVTLRSAPRIANEAINSGIAIAYYNAAGIPDLNGNPWSSTSPNVLDQAKIAAGGLFTQGSVCLQRKFDVFVSPHNSGYSYSLSDATNLGTRTYAQLDAFVQQGGGWTALCHSILSNENAMADLTLNGANSVKSLFKTSQPGGKPGGFLTTTGFKTIDNTGGTWRVDPAAAGLPTAQLVLPTVAPALPGGSVQTWPSQGSPGAPTYWPQTERVGFFDTAGVDHDQIISGTYHDGTGLGKLTYIGGHSFSTAVPYSGNAEAPYLRAFYNSLFFNGSAVAKLDLTHSPATYPQNGTGLVTASIVNSGGSVATNVGNLTVTLAPGFTYAGTTAGPVPSVSLDGRTLTWLGGLGDIAGGATAVKFQVAVAASASSSTGVKPFGQLHATYGDVFGEAFTADICRDLTVSPTPAPKLTKTPSPQGPVRTGSTVSWTLNYGNTGTSPLLGTTLEDRLPPGFSYASSSSSPSLGAATVIPAASGTIVRWNVGSVAANTASAGTVTITARAGPVTNGSGTPPRQTFTNNATLKGQDAVGNPFTAAASADGIVQALDITLGKTVDKSFLSPLPGNLTYTLTPRSDNGDPLDSVRVIDPLPAGVSSPPVSIGQGGTFGAYTPIAAVPGADPGPPALNTAITVSSNFVTQGGTVNVTLNVKSSSAVSSVAPSDPGISGGTATCTGPTPASANVPAGGAGVNFAFSCTLNDLGEYIFSASADDAAATTSWPEASSSSVLSSAGGGPNVVTWNLGSNTDAVGGETIISGYTAGVYGLRGDGTATFQKLEVGPGNWTAKANTLANVAKGGALTTDGAGTIYQLTGGGTQGFAAYNIASNAWSLKRTTGTNVGEGGALVYLNSGPTKYVYALMGGGTKTFKRYDVATNSWAQMSDTPANVKKGGSLATDGTNIYALQGGGQKGFWRYNVVGDSWTPLTSIPDNVNWGGALTRVGSFLYATIGGGKNKFYRYDIGANTWSLMANTPANVTDGGALTTNGTTFIWAFRGKSTDTWRYEIATNTWVARGPFPANTDDGAALVFDAGLNPQGRFSDLSASRSLTVTGDTVKVGFTLSSSTPINDVVAGTVGVNPTGGASCSTLSGPVLTSADDDISSSADTVAYEWTCTVAAGANPGSLFFADNATGSGGVIFPTATSNSVIVSPPLTYTVSVPAGAPNPVINSGVLGASGQAASSPVVSTSTGSPTLTIVKSNSPGEGATVKPGDPITYSMKVENTGSGIATGTVVTDSVPVNTDYASCSGGSACGQSSGTVSWTLGSLAPGDTATVSFTVNAKSTLANSATPYTISNNGTVDSDQTNPVTSNTVTNKLDVQPTIVKTVSAGEAGPGDPLTYTLTVSNPGAQFTGTVTDAVPAGTTFSPGSCSPACSFAGGTVTWGSQLVPHGTSTFSFGVTVNPGTGGSTVTNTSTLDPSSPNLAPIQSNPAETEIGPVLGIVKTNTPTGTVQSGNQITYTLVVSNESSVTAQNALVTDPVPAGTSYGTCTTPVGTCGQSGGTVTFNLGALAGGATVTISFTVTVGTPPVGALEILNQAHVSAGNSPTPVPSNPVGNPLPFPAIVLSKSADQNSYDSVGDVLTYKYVVTNNSTTSTLTGPVTVTDDKATVACPPGNLAPLASITCNASYIVTQADLNAGTVTNTATAHAGGTDSNSDRVIVDAIRAPALALTKRATEASFDSVGDVLHYSYTVENPGNVSLAGPVTVTDDRTGAASCPDLTTVGNKDANLDPGETVVCTATYSVTQADVDAGGVINTATAHAAGTNSNVAQVDVDAEQLPHLTLVKQATLDRTRSPGNARTDSGDVINYTLIATNDGNVTLTGVVISDPTLGALNCAPTPQPATLAPGATLVCTGTRTLTQADIDRGHADNTASVAGTDPDGTAATDTDLENVPLAAEPHLTLHKQATLDRTQVLRSTRSDAGDKINYTLTARNDGNVTLTGVTISDSSLGTLNCAPPPGQPATLAPGEVLVCTATRTLTQADIDAGHADNTASVTGTDPHHDTVTNSDIAIVPLPPEPHLTLVKDGTLDLTPVGPTDRADAGDKINYTLTAINDGNVTLTGVAISDPTLPGLNCALPPDPPPGQPVDLAPGEVLVCTGTHTLTQADIDAGKRDNAGIVAGTDPGGKTISDADDASVPLAREPHLTLAKHAAETSYTTAGQLLHYTYAVQNTGNVSLAGPVTVTDDKAGNASCPAVSSVGDLDGLLDPGETVTCSATYTITQADLNAGLVTNTAGAQAAGTNSNLDQVIVNASQASALTLTKLATESSYDAVNDILHYTYTVENTGNVSLAGPVTVTDDKSTDETCRGLSAVGNGDANLDPGETVVCTATYAVTQADINAGSVTNTATAHAGTTNSNQSQVIVDASQQPHLSFTKEGTLDMTQVAPPDRPDPGDVINYTLTATNDGNVPLTGVAISDPPLTLNCAPPPDPPPGQPVDLAPGEVLVCTGTHTLTQDDINRGKRDNSATAVGTDINGGTIVRNDSATVPVAQVPHLTLLKDGTTDMTQVAPPDRPDAGDHINYTLTATNDGNVTLTGVAISDPTLPGLNCALPPDPPPGQPVDLAPGQVLVCTGTRTLTQADIDIGHADNSATVAGTDPNNKSVTDKDDAHVPLAEAPHLTLVKQAVLDMTPVPPSSRPDPGDHISYTLTAINDGNVTLTGVAISDPPLALNCAQPPDPPPGQPVDLAPGEVLACSGTRTLTQADIDTGHADNTGTVAGTDTNGESVTASDNANVPLGQAPHLTLDKQATLDMTQVAPGTRADAGDVINYTLTAINDGNQTLTGVTISDPSLTLNCAPPPGPPPGQPVDLAPGEVLVCTGTHTLTQADIDTGLVTNNANVAGSDTQGNSVTDSDLALVPLPPQPALALTKDAQETAYDSVGDVLHYSYTVQNTGNVTLQGPVTVSDDRATVTCPPGDLAPQASITCHASYPVTQADLNAGSVTNTATAHAAGTDSNQDQVIVDAVQAPELTLTKQAAETSYDAVGDVLHYTYTVQNTGNVSLAGPVTVTDDRATVTCPPGDLAPQASITCDASYPVTQADLNSGSVTNTATAHAAGTDSNQDQVIVDAQQLPHLTLVKQATLDMAKVAPSNRVDVGDVINYTLTATNDGNVPLTDVQISDPSLALTCAPTSPPPVTLAPGGVLVCTGTRTLTQADIDTGHAINGAGATGTDTNDKPVTDTDLAGVSLGQAPHLTLVKGATLDMAQVAPSNRVDVGDVINYTLTATNDGNVTLTDVHISDGSLALTCAPTSPPPVTLAPGGVLVCTGTRVLTQADINLGKRDNNATVDGTDPDNNPVTAEDSVSVPLAQAPHLTLVKRATLDMAQVAPSNRVDAGDVINYTLTATNDGNVRLTDVQIVDPALALTCAPKPQPATLQPGEALVCTATRVLTQADVNAGRATNSADAAGKDTHGNPVTDSDVALVPLPREPHLTLVKDAVETSYDTAGQLLHYTYTVQNTGNITLLGPVTVADDRATVTCPPGDLAPQALITCQATYTITQNDLDTGHVTNTATAHAGSTNSNQAQVIVDATQVPALTLTKQATETSYDSVGDVLHYTYTVQNTGNITLLGPVTVTDNKATVTCPAGDLAVRASITCTASYTVTQVDLDAGFVTNTATAHAAGTDSNQDQVIVDASQGPHLTLVKQATLDMAKVAPSNRVDPGDVINYTLTATNDGNVTLTDVQISDPPLALNCAPPPPPLPVTLAPGAVLVCTGTRPLTQADINLGHADNKGTVVGTDPTGAQVDDSDTVSVPLGQAPHLTLVKQATLDMAQVAPSNRADAGDHINYTLTATNDGNVPLTGVAISDPPLTLNCAQPPDPPPGQPVDLAPGEVLICSGTRTLTQADIDTGHAINRADVAGTDTNGDLVAGSDVAGVPLAGEPHLTLVKQATLDTTIVGPADRPDAGDVINYKLTATNDGNVTLTGVKITDPSLTLSCAPTSQPATLAPGDMLICTGTRTLTEADIGLGHADNTATAAGTDNNSNPIADSDSASVPLAREPHLTLVKDAIEPSYNTVGDVIHYTFTVTNTGNISLAGPVKVTDDKSTDESCLAVASFGNNNDLLDPGETVVCSATYTITQDDLNAGRVTNTATAHAGGTDSNTDQVTVRAIQAPELTLTKHAAETSYDAVGEVLHYTYTVENTGNVAFAGPVTVTDDRSTDESCPALSTVGNNDTFLDPSETVTCTATYTVTQDDMDAGAVTNTATAHAGGTDSNEDQVIVHDVRNPQIQITKSSNATAATTVGDTVTFTFLVTNVGDITITSFTVSDPLPGVSAIDCTGQPSQLAPGDSAACTATYTVTQADVSAGLILNLASVDGQTTNAGPVTDSDQLTTPLTPLGTLQIVKRLDPATDGGRFDLNIDGGAPEATGVGDGGHTAAVPVSPQGDHSVSETAANGTDLADYATAITCTRNGGSLPNLDPAHVTVGLDDAVVCTITNSVKPAGLAITKSAPEAAHDGDSITYGIRVGNSGVVALRNVSVGDNIGSTGRACDSGPTLTGGDTNGDGNLDPTETWSYSCTYAVQHGDEDATHHIVNVARVTATNGSGLSVGPVGASATTLITHPAIALLKTGPATARAGDSIAYELAVSNAGDTSFAGSTVRVTDRLCSSNSLRLTGRGRDTSSASLDPGDKWTYGCLVKTAAGDTAVHNSATVQATDQYRTTVNARDSADTDLKKQPRGRAKLSGRTGCVYKTFTATVRGARIAKVAFVLDGKVVKRVTNGKNAALIRVRINPARLHDGTHRFMAKVTFAVGTGTKPKTLRFSFKLCPKQIVSPRFTG